MAVIPEAAQAKAEEAKQARDTNQRTVLGPGSITGNLTADPELRYTSQGRAVCRLRVAHTPRVQDPKSHEWKDGAAQFFDVTAWGKLGEHCAEYLAKGQRIVADGQWESRAWEDQDGNTQEAIGLVARDLGPSMLFKGARVVEASKGGA